MIVPAVMIMNAAMEQMRCSRMGTVCTVPELDKPAEYCLQALPLHFRKLGRQLSPCTRTKTQHSHHACAVAQELEDLLAQPLQASFSRRFFTGVPSASLAAKAPVKPHAAAPPQVSADAPADGSEDEPEAAAEDVPDVMPDMDQQAAEHRAQQQQQQSEREQGLKQTVALAQKLASSRQLAKVSHCVLPTH